MAATGSGPIPAGPPRAAVLVAAAGRSERFGGAKKELVEIGGRSVLDHAVAPFLELPGLEALAIAAPPGREAEIRASLSASTISSLEARLGPRFSVIAGGSSRRDSVRLGLEALAAALFESAPSDGGTAPRDGGSADYRAAPGSGSSGIAPADRDSANYRAAPGSGSGSGGIAPADRDSANYRAAPGSGSSGIAPADRDSANYRAAPGSRGAIVVLVHDGARPWASPDLVARVTEAARANGAAVPVIPLVDTPKLVDPSGLVKGHPARSSLAGAQTPQGFDLGRLLAAHRRALAEGVDCTDDAELWDRYEGRVAWVAGEEANRKVTVKADLGPWAPDARERSAPDGAGSAGAASAGSGPEPSPRGPVPPPGIRVGQGWDIHRLVPGRPLVLGGVEIPFELGEDGHSDGDVLIHAAIDALLGAAALGDIGTHFPPSEDRWRGADSRGLAATAVGLVRGAGWECACLDCTVVIERPRLAPHREAIRRSLADAFGLDPAAVSVKAKTKEGVDAAGEGRAVEAQAIALLYRASGARPG